MTASTTGLEPVRAAMAGRGDDPQDKPVTTPMSQQSAFGCHGYDMHPQEFVRLSGCQELKLRREKKRALVLS
ncbi:hypothetical protein SSBR45G_02400 [Bradyrhizobium sp. SSBR45G]|uniref:hypothetical protein n=1 Tax=unclassified Bradyrhizobium TaxID=2631580 RepID=UPI00234293B8|nr:MULTISPECIES: hypothetical protein [unclassified Bradyrhizobium]GLH75332.1 hypothetical protein SSBR45G_02400 [Bradyrhizobium sp. SSBR45G]GLH82881.1 hypothetical protein SSBR45R_03410 [Bradyrhizobium sp. SSBR45R]